MPHRTAAFRSRLCVAAVLAALFLAPAAGRTAETVDPFGDCCVAKVTMTGPNAWQVTCGACAVNPGTYAVRQPDPNTLVFVGPNGVSAASRYEAAQAICRCPSQKARQAREKSMRTFDGK